MYSKVSLFGLSQKDKLVKLIKDQVVKPLGALKFNVSLQAKGDKITADGNYLDENIKATLSIQCDLAAKEKAQLVIKGDMVGQGTNKDFKAPLLTKNIPVRDLLNGQNDDLKLIKHIFSTELDKAKQSNPKKKFQMRVAAVQNNYQSQSNNLLFDYEEH